MYTVTQIEDSLLSLLRADTALSAYVRTFSILPALDEKTIERLLIQLPAIGVLSTTGSYSYATSSKQQETGEFSIICFNRNLRSSTSAIAGGIPSEKGVWDMIDDCRAAILPGSLDLNILDCIAKRRVLLFAGEKWAAAALEIEVKWRN